MRTLALASLFALTLSGASRADDGVSFLQLDPDVQNMMASAGLPTPILLEGSALAGQQQQASAPRHGPFGLGIEVGTPTAITMKYRLSGSQSIQAGVGAAWAYRGFATGLFVYGDYLFDVAQLVSNSTLGLSLYIGPGAWMSFFSHGYVFGYGYNYYPGLGMFALGARVPFGLSMMFRSAPVEVFLQLDPSLMIFPGVDFGIGASLGFRFYF